MFGLGYAATSGVAGPTAHRQKNRFQNVAGGVLRGDFRAARRPDAVPPLAARAKQDVGGVTHALDTSVVVVTNTLLLLSRAARHAYSCRIGRAARMKFHWRACARSNS